MDALGDRTRIDDIMPAMSQVNRHHPDRRAFALHAEGQKSLKYRT